VVLGKNFEFRDYFRGASALGRAAQRGVYLSRTYRAESSGIFTFCFAAPVFAADGTWLGNVVAALQAASAIGQVRMQGPAGSGRLVALLGPRDNERAWKGRALPTELFFVVHPRLSRGREVPLAGLARGALGSELGVGAPAGHQFALRWAEPRLVADYRDPLSEPAESWLAAFSPVGQTGYVVVVQTSREAAVGSNRILNHTLLVNMSLPLAVGFSLLILVARSPARRRRGLRARPSEAIGRR
jgi:hypothetical protein